MNNTQFLTEQIDRLLKLEVIKKQKKLMNDLDLIKKRLNDKTFRITVVGEFSSGKSTFINAMIGKDLLKHSIYHFGGLRVVRELFVSCRKSCKKRFLQSWHCHSCSNYIYRTNSKSV